MTRFIRSLLLVLAVSWLASPLAAQPRPEPSLPWSVVCEHTRGHHDGDTFACVPSPSVGDSFVVRFAGIDAPETGQAYWTRSRDLLREVAPGGTKVACYKRDRFNRLVCRVYSPDGQDAADRMLASGLAWHSVAYASEQTAAERVRYARLSAQAREGRQGLFIESDPQPPWDCRRAKERHEHCR